MSEYDDCAKVKVKWATSAENYLPFTPLPAKYKNKTVALIILKDDTNALAEQDQQSFP